MPFGRIFSYIAAALIAVFVMASVVCLTNEICEAEGGGGVAGEMDGSNGAHVEKVFLLAMAFVSLIVAIISWIGVGNVAQVHDVAERFRRDIRRFENDIARYGKEVSELGVAVKENRETIDRVESAARQFEDKIARYSREVSELEAAVKKNRETIDRVESVARENQLLLEKRREFEGFLKIQTGIDIEDRVGAAQSLLSIEGIAKQYAFFEDLYREAKERFESEEGMSERERGNWQLLVRLLEILAGDSAASM